jgi:hypothetical protein
MNTERRVPRFFKLAAALIALIAGIFSFFAVPTAGA